MKRKRTFQELSVGSLEFARASSLRPSVNKVSSYVRKQSRHISESLPIKRRKFTKGAMELLSDLTASFSEKMMTLASRIAQDKKNAKLAVDLDFTVALSAEDVSLAASYVVFPNLIDSLRLKRARPICEMLLAKEEWGGEPSSMENIEEERNARVRERGVNSLLLK